MNAKGRDEETVSHLAANCGHKNCLKVLADAGFDANVADVYSNTAGWYAAQLRNIECFMLLVKNGLDLGKGLREFARRERIPLPDTWPKRIWKPGSL